MTGKVSNTPTRLNEHEANKRTGCGKVYGVRIHGMGLKQAHTKEIVQLVNGIALALLK